MTVRCRCGAEFDPDDPDSIRRHQMFHLHRPSQRPRKE